MQLTKNFSLTEFNFRDLPITEVHAGYAESLAENLQVIRDFLAMPVKVTSWLRLPVHNASIAGASKTSQHLRGEAVDFVVSGVDANGLDDLFELLHTGKIKLPNPCSQIIRETKGEAEWLHMGLKTQHWLDQSKAVIANPASNSMDVSKHKKRLTHCEFLRTPDTIKYTLIGYKPYGDFG
jgi:hypothetical protein